MSRYLILSAASPQPKPMVATTTATMASGHRNNAVSETVTLNQMTMTIKSAKAMMKSNNDTSTAATGITSRGKYILLIISALPTMLCAAPVSPVEKKFQTTSPER